MFDRPKNWRLIQSFGRSYLSTYLKLTHQKMWLKYKITSRAITNPGWGSNLGAQGALRPSLVYMQGPE